MASEDEFEAKLGRMRAQEPKMPKSHRTRVVRAVQRAGGFKGGSSGRRQMPAGYGRGAGVAHVLKGAGMKGSRARRVVVKARFIKLAGKGARAAAAHLSYLKRDGVTRDGGRGVLYGLDADRVEASDFMARCEDDRHQFRFIVAPEDSLQYDDLKPLTRKVMAQMETDLGTRLDWVAVDHFNTGHPHTHIVLRGRDDQGKDLVIARDYLSQGFRERVQAQVTLDFGPRSDREITAGLQAEVSQERLTSFDRQFRREAGEEGRVLAGHSDPVLSALRVARMTKLEGLGLAQNLGEGAWQLHPDMEETLRALGERGDIIKTLHRALKERGLEAGVSDAQMHLAGAGASITTGSLTGRLVQRGLLDEQSDRHYIILEGIDGRAHYVDIGQGSRTEPLPDGAILQVTPRVPEMRDVDRTVLAVAKANGGYYSVELHLKFDATARLSFAETHVRRLEAIRRATGAVERLPDGRFRIEPNHLEKAMAYERKEAARAPVSVSVQASRSLERQTRFNGVTWLDNEWVSGTQSTYGQSGFGGEARAALQLRQQWLVEEGLWTSAPGEGAASLSPSVLKALHRREMADVSASLEAEMAKTYRPMANGASVEGRLRQVVEMGSGKYAVVERAKDFALVPWRPILDKHVGKDVSGIVRESGINWTIGRARGLELE